MLEAAIFITAPQNVGRNKQHTDDFAFITAVPVVDLKIHFVLRAVLREESWGRSKQNGSARIFSVNHPLRTMNVHSKFHAFHAAFSC